MGYKIDIDTSGKNLNIIDSKTNRIIKDVSLAKIFDDFVKEFDLSGRFTDFADLNKKINNGDCIKDGTPESTLQQLDLFDNFSLAELKDLAHDVIDKAEKKGYAVRQEFTREKKGDDSIKQRYKGFEFDIGYDAGLGPENFLDTKMYKLFTNFGKHVDSFIITPTQVFPSQGNNIEITGNTFNQIGYDNCEVNATATSLDKFTYKITLSGLVLEQYNGTAKDKDNNIQDYFIGNSKKNTFIKSASKDTKTKKAMVVGKSWGDKLQTFIMWIKHKTDGTGRITVMSTCDEIVMLFSIILGLPCFYTDIGLNKEKQKINRVLYFNTSQMNRGNAKSRFDNEKSVILKGYTDFIKLIRTCKETTDIYIKEIDDRPFNFEDGFYKAIIDDLEKIKRNIENISVNSSVSVPDINAKIDELKKTKVDDFLKKGNNGLVYMIRSKAKYNENSNNNTKANLASAAGMPETKVRSATFHFIATTYFNVNMRGGGGSPSKIHTNMDLIFDMDPKYVYLEDGSRFDANLSLFEELYELYNEHMHTEFDFISLYSESLHRLSIEPDYTSGHLSKLVTEIFHDFTKFEEANAELKTYVDKMMKTPVGSPSEIAKVDMHISPTEKKGHTITIFEKSKDNKTRDRRSRSRDNKTRGRRIRSRSRDRKPIAISRSRSRDRRSRSRDRRSRSRDRRSRSRDRRSRSRDRMIVV